jgi:hypothetical protein
MRLIDLNPRWSQPHAMRFASPPIYLGVSFDCPCCRSQRLSVAFRQPIDPEKMLAATSWEPHALSWDRQGETFEALTLLPSIDFSSSGHWHGHIINGQIQ